MSTMRRKKRQSGMRTKWKQGLVLPGGFRKGLTEDAAEHWETVCSVLPGQSDCTPESDRKLPTAGSSGCGSHREPLCVCVCVSVCVLGWGTGSVA